MLRASLTPGSPDRESDSMFLMTDPSTRLKRADIIYFIVQILLSYHFKEPSSQSVWPQSTVVLTRSSGQECLATTLGVQREGRTHDGLIWRYQGSTSGRCS